MKKIVYSLGCLMIAGAMIACGGAKKDAQNAGENADSVKTAENAAPQYTVVEKPQIDLSKLAKDKDGFITIFDGKTFEGWRGYGKDNVPGKWTIDQGAIKFNGTGGGEAQDKEGGDIIFAHKFKNFELTFDWKVAKGSNSGVFFLAQEIETTNDKGEKRMEPIYISSPEYQILDNANHPDAKMGKDNNRQSASLYDMIPAVPQNSKPFGEWNTGKIMVYKGTVVHGQNGENVVEYHLWTPQWTELLQASKFSQEKWPLAFELLNNLGGANREGYIGFQDHGDDVWFRNIKIKILD
ncbi:MULTISPECIES: 3-keto-disaccharide hydrolase [Dysgonomonas]|uniref:3-keto-alpha-glucoside-1,2-lyase/3-keto-2-hydroxy-glucal hydratase domain-containing protein n=1 Tax=Dysgonomonas gadei ATCC BAA-286 TaxID=742766 RepID=F5IWN8_9BACT|nr:MULTISPECIES: DUF1080 domain-containing protein [Dysgonomonas]EGK02235.1 hypothetical protein HMPREF9455_01505 [Dysgonomonas gadei ATCC BAA-286]MBF0651397.1 DUF1080 domain-containing protein [Dysgonomonas sp. GY75]